MKCIPHLNNYLSNDEGDIDVLISVNFIHSLGRINPQFNWVTTKTIFLSILLQKGLMNKYCCKKIISQKKISFLVYRSVINHAICFHC